MTSQLKLFRRALLILKENATGITVSDDTKAVNTLNLVYSDVVQRMLEEGRWNFAARSQQIDASTDIEPDFGFSNAFVKPDDYVNLIKISHSETFFPPFLPNQYVDEGGYWYANCDPLYVSFVSDDEAYGGDLSLWPEVFAEAVAYELASQIGPHLTAMSGTEKETLERDKKLALRNASSWDAAKNPPDPLPFGRMVRGRSAMRGTYWRERR